MNPIDAQLRRGMDWRHGAFTVVGGIGGGSPVFYSLDREDKLTDTAAFRNPEPTRMYHFSYDRQTDGTIVFSGQTETVPRVVSPFLAWISADGKYVGYAFE